MSSMENVDLSRSSKFTRGEKCIFIHLVLTFVLTLVSTMIYFIHLYLVEHPGNSYLNTRRSSQQHHEGTEIEVPDYLPVGALYLNVTHFHVTCNTIQLREKWSIAPAHCVIIRTDPSMAQWLPEWIIEYRTVDFKFIVTDIKRSIAHPKFDRDDFSNNIGLLEHASLVPIHQYISFKNISTENSAIRMQDENLHIAEWMPHLIPSKDVRGTYFTLHSVNTLDWAQCNNYMAPVVDIRNYEYCISLPKTDTVDLNHGAALLRGFEIVGFFSWGERQRRTLPLIILQIAEFQDWIQDVVTVADAFN